MGILKKSNKPLVIPSTMVSTLNAVFCAIVPITSCKIANILSSLQIRKEIFSKVDIYLQIHGKCTLD
jgi:hypothetical protein